MKLVKIKYLLLASVCVAHVSAMEPSNGNDCEDLGRKRSLTLTSGFSTIESFDSLDNSPNKNKHNSVKFFKKSKNKRVTLNKRVTFNPNVNVQKSKTFVEIFPGMNELNKLFTEPTTFQDVIDLVSVMNKEAGITEEPLKNVIDYIKGSKNIDVANLIFEWDYFINCINELNRMNMLNLSVPQLLEIIKNHNKETFSHTIS